MVTFPTTWSGWALTDRSALLAWLPTVGVQLEHEVVVCDHVTRAYPGTAVPGRVSGSLAAEDLGEVVIHAVLPLSDGDAGKLIGADCPTKAARGVGPVRVHGVPRRDLRGAGNLAQRHAAVLAGLFQMKAELVQRRHGISYCIRNIAMAA